MEKTISDAEFFRDWFNNYLSVGCMAEHYGIDDNACSERIERGRIEHELGVVDGQKVVNGYRITYNAFWKKYQTSHPDVGVTEEFKTLNEAIEYCEKG